MRVQARSCLFAVLFLGGGLAIFNLVARWSFFGALGLAVVWFVAVAVAQFRVFRCPHCGKVAVFTPGGTASPLVGTRCQYCGRPY